jgi:glycosyltransferase involved in cell wall biosynthesis
LPIPSGLTNKVILILTPQAWGKMKLAKHHYAIELAKLGNEVYFLNPPDNHRWSWSKKRIRINPVEDQPGLFIIDQQLYFPYRIKFHSRNIYNRLIKKQIKDILRAVHKPIDIIWSFDIGNLFPLSFFDKGIFKVFHPVDEPSDKNAIAAASGANVLFSVTREIINKYRDFQIPAEFINHGLPDEFIGIRLNQPPKGQPINVGLSGNFLRPDLDRQILIQIVRGNPECRFHFFGIYVAADSNIGSSGDVETNAFIDRLQDFTNVEFHGVLKTKELAIALNRMDALLICYDMQLDQSKGTNYHKVMEYLSTGKVIISNNITTYREYPDLIRMNESREDNKLLPALFRDTITNLFYWNSDLLMNQRKSFANKNTYSDQLERIGNFIQDTLTTMHQ